MPVVDNEFPNQCPFCGEKHDMASGVAERGKTQHTPTDGDLTLCIVCGEWAFFDSKVIGGLRKPTDAEYVTIGETAFLRKMRKAWVDMNKRFRAGPPERVKAHERR
jgi:hypothetical protein